MQIMQLLLAIEQEMHFDKVQNTAGILLTYFWTGRSRHVDYSNV